MSTRKYLPLGTHVRASDTLVRVTLPAAPNPRRAWVRWGSQEAATPRYSTGPVPAGGIVVGARTLANGDLLALYYDEQPRLTRIESIPVYLIAHSLHEKPVIAHYHDVRPAVAA
jgi:hypothetical protein